MDLESQHKDRVVTLSGDIADPALAQRAVDLAVTTWGRLDGLIVNHGTLDPVAAMRDAKIMDWKAAFDTNVFGVVALVRIALRCKLEIGHNSPSRSYKQLWSLCAKAKAQFF